MTFQSGNGFGRRRRTPARESAAVIDSLAHRQGHL